jgi:hypothetical protein
MATTKATLMLVLASVALVPANAGAAPRKPVVAGGCRVDAPTGGVITAGAPIRIKGKTYQEPIPTGNGTCLATTTSGYDFARWSDGTQTVVKFTTASGDGATHLTGSVVPNITLKTVDGTGSTTFRTTRFAGQVVVGLLKFAAKDPSLCTTTGLTSAGITGLLGHVGDRDL